MTIAVDLGRKATKQTNKLSLLVDTTVVLCNVIKRILHECSCFIEFIKRVGEKR